MASRTFASTSIFVAPAAAIFIAGYSFAFSQNAVPPLYNERPHHGVPIFKRFFFGGAYVAIGLSLTSSVCSTYLAYLCTSSTQRQRYIIAALATLIPMPFTGVVMIPGIKRLITISEDLSMQEKSEQTLEHRQLLKAWVLQNYVRSALYITGGGLGLWAAIFG